jgi:hypothetical protein
MWASLRDSKYPLAQNVARGAKQYNCHCKAADNYCGISESEDPDDRMKFGSRAYITDTLKLLQVLCQLEREVKANPFMMSCLCFLCGMH